MIFNKIILPCIAAAFFFIGCEEKVDESVISKGAQVSSEEKARANEMDKKSYAEVADVFRDTSVIKPDGKFLLLVFGANGCVYCEMLKDDIKKTPPLKSKLQESFTPYYINGSYTKSHQLELGAQSVAVMTSDLIRLYGIRPTPTLIFADQTGKTLFTYPGYMPPEQFSTTLDFVTSGAWKGLEGEAQIVKALKAFVSNNKGS